MLGVVPTLGETVARSHKVEKQRICTLALLLLALLLRSFGLSLAIGIFLYFFCLEDFFCNTMESILLLPLYHDYARASAQCFGKHRRATLDRLGNTHGKKGVNNGCASYTFW